ncbi:MAG: hypothetical protein DRJ10_16650, partial [Bacteroidetes bacterium]
IFPITGSVVCQSIVIPSVLADCKYGPKWRFDANRVVEIKNINDTNKIFCDFFIKFSPLF